MLSVQNMTLDSFLPLSRMKELGAAAHSSYINARPCPHMVFDDFFDPGLLDLVLAEFPQPSAIRVAQESRKARAYSANQWHPSTARTLIPC
jgi:hypothetical protein